MSKSRWRVAVVGSGSAGPAAALFLTRSGHEVTLFERAEKELAVGAGFLLQPTGLSVLRELGLAEPVLASARRIDGLYCETRTGRVLLDLKYRELRDGMCGLGTHRSALLRILLQACREAGVILEWGREITGLKKGRNGWSLQVEAGGAEGPFDLVLICDGARSRLRGQTGIPHRVDGYPWGAFWFIGRRTAEFAPGQLWQKVGSTRELCGFLPTGTDDDLLSLFWSIRLDQPQPDLEEWKSRVVALVPRAACFLEQVTSLDQLQRASYHDVRMARWHGEGIGILGDAGHALSPQLGQGVNLALVDASVLARCLAGRGLQQGLADFSRLRRRQLRFYQLATRWTTPFFQSDHIWLGWLRDLGFPLAMKTPLLRREMVTVMAGLKNGPLSRFSLE
jgi:2-polyprenyl-6-methoxyphenol hydroxylase-like FAD-dependent oxidoreductase